MAAYKLYYFPFKGRGEPIRLLLTYQGIYFEDVRIPANEEWLKFKPSTPFESLPVLEETGGKMLGGSITILRYLAEKEEFNLAGSNAWENAQLASISGFINDLYEEVVRGHFEKDEARKKEMHEKLKNETTPKYLGKLNEMAKDGYLYGTGLTWPDFQLYCVFELFLNHSSEIGSLFPNLMKIKSNIEANPNVIKYLAIRPKSDY